MQTTGIIIEYNPMHRGHLYFLKKIQKILGENTALIGVMSGNFVQRGDFAILRKHARAGAAVLSGLDLVLELPVSWAVSSAERFADGGVQVLQATGIVDDLAFGSECGEVGLLWEIANCLFSPDFSERLRQELRRDGASYAVCRQRVIQSLLGREYARLLEQPNNILGIEYCKSLLRHQSQIRPMTIRRIGAAHDAAWTGESGEESEKSGSNQQILSASAIRTLLKTGRESEALKQMVPDMRKIYQSEVQAGRAPVFLETCERAILARLRSMNESDFAMFDQGREGLYHRLYRISRSAASLNKFLELAKNKRYAHAHLRRMILQAYLGLTPSCMPEKIDYLRPLAANYTGRKLLAQMRQKASVPILTKPADVRRLDINARMQFEQEVHASNLYTLAYPRLDAAEGGVEWRESPWIFD